MGIDNAIQSALKRDRRVVAAGLVAITVLAWLYMLDMAAGMTRMDMPAMAMAAQPWDAGRFFMMFIMWAVMMVAMMVPSAAPTVLLYSTVVKNKNGGSPPPFATTFFTSGYLIAWTFFSLLATTIQWGLSEAALLSPKMASASPYLAGGLLIGAGIYQWTPLKNACLSHCRSPLEYLSGHWRKGPGAPLFMGLHHGTYCLGCCWALMALLFVLGVMNLLWVAAIALFVLVEKLTPAGVWLGRAGGVALAAWGVYTIAAAGGGG